MCFLIQPFGVVQPEQEDASVSLAWASVLLMCHLHSQDNPSHQSWVPFACWSTPCLQYHSLGLPSEGGGVLFHLLTVPCSFPGWIFSIASLWTKSSFHAKMATLACWIPQWIPSVETGGPLSGFLFLMCTTFQKTNGHQDLQPSAFVCKVHLEER